MTGGVLRVAGIRAAKAGGGGARQLNPMADGALATSAGDWRLDPSTGVGVRGGGLGVLLVC